MNDSEVQAGLAEYERIRNEMPPEVVTALQGLKDKYGVDVPTIKATFATYASNPQVKAQPNRWDVAMRGTAAKLTAIINAKQFEFEFQPIALATTPRQSKVDPSNPKKARADWKFRVEGMARCTDPKSPFDGPAALMVTGFGDPKTATGVAQRFLPGHVYKVFGALSKSGGTPSPGSVPAVFVDGQGRITEVPDANGRAWPNAYDSFSADIAVSPMSNLLIHPPAKYAHYKVEGEIVSARRGVGNNGEYATMVLRDDSIDGALLTTFGGLSLFLAPADFPKVQLPVGSRVGAIVTGYEADGKDAQGNVTGNKVNRYSAVAMKVILDLSGGTEISNPSGVAVKIPEGTPSPVATHEMNF